MHAAHPQNKKIPKTEVFGIFLFLKILIRPLEPFLEAHFRFPGEEGLRLFVRQGGPVDISFPGGAIGGGYRGACDLCEGMGEIVQAGLGFRAEVAAGVAGVGGEGLPDAPCDIAGVDEVPGLFPVAEDGDALTLRQPFGEDADDAALAAVALAFAVDVGEPERHVVDAEDPMVQGQVLLHRQLCESVEGEGLSGVAFGNGEVFLRHIAVHGGGGGKDDPRHVVLPAALQDPHRAVDVLVHIILRVLDGGAHQGLPGEMHHAVEVLQSEEVFHLLVVDVHHLQPCLLRQVLPKPGGQVIQGNGLVPRLHELPDQMGTDKSGSSCN